MPKSRHSHRKKLHHVGKDRLPVAVQPQQEASAQISRPVTVPRATAPSAGVAARSVESYTFIGGELIRIGVLAVIIFAILIILYFVLS